MPKQDYQNKRLVCLKNIWNNTQFTNSIWKVKNQTDIQCSNENSISNETDILKIDQSQITEFLNIQIENLKGDIQNNHQKYLSDDTSSIDDSEAFQNYNNFTYIDNKSIDYDSSNTDEKIAQLTKDLLISDCIYASDIDQNILQLDVNCKAKDDWIDSNNLLNQNSKLECDNINFDSSNKKTKADIQENPDEQEEYIEYGTFWNVNNKAIQNNSEDTANKNLEEYISDLEWDNTYQSHFSSLVSPLKEIDSSDKINSDSSKYHLECLVDEISPQDMQQPTEKSN